MSELTYDTSDFDPTSGGGPAARDGEPVHRLIRASAGAGKTYQLTQHFLKLLRGGAALDTILATTFTRKAAGEILGRVIKTLAEEADKPGGGDAAEGEKSSRQLLAELSANLHRVSISTIDSFFHRLGSSFRYELDLPLEPRLMDEGSATATRLRAEAIEAVLADAAADDEKFIALLVLLRRLHHDQASRSVTRAIDQIVLDHAEVYRQAPDRETWTQLEVTGLLDDRTLNEAIDGWRQMKPYLPVKKDGEPRAHWYNSWVKIGQQAKVGDWENIANSGMLTKLIAGEEKFDRVEFSLAWLDAATPFLKHLTGLLLQQVAHQTEATYELMGRFAVRYDQLRRQRGVMLYSDLTHRLAAGAIEQATPDVSSAEVLGEIYFRLDQAVTHLLLDEFQDTSLDQWTVLSPFAQEVTSTGDGSRSLFVVGDTKQAIYGWRGGCAALFDEVQHLVPVSGRSTLAKSRRSSQTILDAVNTVFADLGSCDTLDSEKYPEDLAAGMVWSQQFERHDAFKKDLPGFVSYETTDPASDTFDAEDDDRDVREEISDADEDESLGATSHEKAVAHRIEALYRSMPGRTIGVLVSTNGAVNRLLYELRCAGLPASGEGGNPISDTPAVAAMLSALQMADHPGATYGRSAAAAFHTLNSPLGPLLKMKQLGDAAKVARQVRARLLADGYAATIAGWVAALADQCDAAGLAKLTRLIELAEEYDAQPIEALRPGRFVAHVESSRVEEPSSALIRVMTIHKSKGLEFDAVVLPELDRKLSNRYPVLVDRPDPTGAIEAVYRYPGQAARAVSEELTRVYAQQRGRRRQEDLCSLYVAMTRARQGLYLIAKPTVKPDGKSRTIGLCFAGILRDTLGDPDQGPLAWGDADWMRASAGKSADVSPRSVGDSRAAVLTVHLGRGQAKRMRPTVAPSQLHGHGTVHAADLLDVEPTSAARQRGTTLHEDFELIAYVDDPEGNIPESLKAIVKHDAIRAAMTRRFGSSEELWRERSFIVAEEDRLLRGTFDRVVIDRSADGQATAAHLIDFKTDRVDAESKALKARVEGYRPQVEAYRRALSSMLKLDASKVTAELLFTTPGVSVAV